MSALPGTPDGFVVNHVCGTFVPDPDGDGNLGSEGAGTSSATVPAAVGPFPPASTFSPPFGPGGAIAPTPNDLTAGNAIDHRWIHDDVRAPDPGDAYDNLQPVPPFDPIVFDMGAATTTVDYFPVIDHPDLPNDGFAVVLTGSTVGPNGPFNVTGDITIVWEEGWDAANPDTYIDDFIQRWEFPVPVQWIAVQVEPGLFPDAEVDAVCRAAPPLVPGAIIVEKQTVPAGSTQAFTFNTSYAPGTFQLTDGQQNDSGDLPPDTYSVSEAPEPGWTLTSATCANQNQVAEDPSNIVLEENEVVTCTFVNTQDATGGEGCTPGFWKQRQHLANWAGTGYSLTDSFEVVFGVPDAFPGPGPTLLQALDSRGGGMNALARHATAALLNASSPDVDYAYTPAEVIAMVQAAVANPTTIESTKNLFVTQNEAGCPLS